MSGFLSYKQGVYQVESDITYFWFEGVKPDIFYVWFPGCMQLDMSLCTTSHQEPQVHPINFQVIDKLPGQIPFHPFSFGQVKLHSIKGH